MDMNFVTAFMLNKPKLREHFEKAPPRLYKDPAGFSSWLAVMSVAA
jgi:hypothetical protein